MSGIFRCLWASIGNTAVACGNLSDKFELTRGITLEIDSKWAARLTVKRDSEWIVAGFHVSTNVFDNSVPAMVRSWMTKLVIAAAFVDGRSALGLGIASM